MPDPPPPPPCSSTVARGDADALAALYREHFERLARLVAAVTRRGDDFARDAAQDAFLRALRSMPPLGSPDAERAWLDAAAISAARDRLRAEARRARRERRHAESRPPPAGDPRPDDDPADALAAAARALERLHADERWLIDARLRFNWTLRRIGLEVGLSSSAVDGRLTRLLARVREALDRPPGRPPGPRRPVPPSRPLTPTAPSAPSPANPEPQDAPAR